jgi:uncharacterized protein (TIGR02147 family)
MPAYARDYRETIRQAMETRSARNPRYSLRSFARDLGISPSRLSDVLNGRYGISVEAAELIAKGLGLSHAETKAFCDQVESQHARGQHQRKAAQARLAAAGASYHSINLDGFQVISDWYHYAILELALTKDFRSSFEWIAQTLELNVQTVKSAVARLKRLDLLLEDSQGQFRPSDSFTASPDGVPSDAIKKFHRQILEKAITAIDFQSLDERDFSSMVLALDSSRLAEAKQEIKRFRREFDAKFGSSGTKTEVYCLSNQLFRLQTKSEGSK